MGDSVVALTGSEVNVPYDAPELRFLVKPKPGFVAYQLEGFDKRLKERDGQMYFGIRFFGADGDQVDEASFLASRRSPGWKNTLQNSSFTPRHETITVPPGADHLSVFMTSAGPPSGEGVIAVTGISIERPSRTGAGRQLVFSSAPFLENVSSASDLRSPPWVPGGPRPSMARIAELHGPNGPFRALEIDDDDITSHADWSTVAEQGPRVAPGEVLDLRWKEAYSNSMADPFWANYGQLAPGDYRFKVVRMDLSGAPVATLDSMRVHVLLPYWRNPWYWGISIAGLVAAIVFATWFALQTNVNRQLERNRLIEEERMRIARDIHDTLAQGFTGIIAQLEAAKGVAHLQAASAHIERAEDLARASLDEARRSLRALRPRPLNGATLGEALANMVNAVAHDSGLKAEFIVEGKQQPMPPAWEEGLLRVAQEGLTNAIKHSGAANFRLLLSFAERRIELKLMDDGRGFDPEGDHDGFGLIGMRERVEKIGGTFSIHSRPGRGTEIVVTLQSGAPAKGFNG